MPCEFSDRDQRIDDFLMHKLSSADAEAFEIHLFGCKECLAELRLREQMIKIIKEERVTAISDVARPRGAKSSVIFAQTIGDFLSIRPSAWVYAGVVAALLIAILVLPKFHEKKIAENYAANFTPSPQLESMMRQPRRSSDWNVAVASPRNGESFASGNILFRWQIPKGEESVDLPLELKILNNQEVVIYNAPADRQEYSLRQRLAPGLYYWTLEHQGEMVYLGKFFIR